MKKELTITKEEEINAIQKYGKRYYLDWLYKRLTDGGVPVSLKDTAKSKYTRPLEDGDIVCGDNLEIYVDGIGGEKTYIWNV